MPQSRNPETCPEPYATRTDPTRTAKSRRHQNWTIGASSRPPTLTSRPAPSRRYGARLDRGRDGAAVTDRGVAHLRRAPYVAGIVHRWDFRRPSLPGPGCSWRCPDDRHDSSTALATIQPAFTGAERLALAGFLAGYRGLTREAYTLDLRQFSGWCRHDRCRCSRSAAPTSRPSPASWKPAAAPAPPSPGGCAPSPGSTSTPSKKSSSSTRPPRTSAVPGWTTSRTQPLWTATRSGRSWSPPASARPASTR